MLQGIFLFLVGMAVGALALTRVWLSAMSKPEKAREFLMRMHATSHPHRLQVSLNDTTPVCPCCGWTEDGARSGSEVRS